MEDLSLVNIAPASSQSLMGKQNFWHHTFKDYAAAKHIFRQYGPSLAIISPTGRSNIMNSLIYAVQTLTEASCSLTVQGI